MKPPGADRVRELNEDMAGKIGSAWAEGESGLPRGNTPLPELTIRPRPAQGISPPWPQTRAREAPAQAPGPSAWRLFPVPAPGERLQSSLASCPVAVGAGALLLLPIGQSPAPGCSRRCRFG